MGNAGSGGASRLARPGSVAVKRTGKLLGCSGARYYAFQESEGVWPVRWRDDRGVEHEDSTYPDARGAAARVAVLNGEAYKAERQEVGEYNHHSRQGVLL